MRFEELGEGFCLCYSNKLRSNWDCLIIDARVPGLRSSCSGTGRVIVESGASFKFSVVSRKSAVPSKFQVFSRQLAVPVIDTIEYLKIAYAVAYSASN